MPRGILPFDRFCYEELLFHELVPARFVQSELLITAVVYAKDGVAYWPSTSTKTRIHVERRVEAVFFTASLDYIKTTSMVEGVE